MLISILYAAVRSKISTLSSIDPLNRLTAKNSADFLGRRCFCYCILQINRSNLSHLYAPYSC